MELVASLVLFFISGVVQGQTDPACDPSTRPVALSGSGSFTSPNWSEYGNTTYPNNAYCEWTITAPAGERLQLSYGQLDIEACTDCKCDSLTIWEGSDENGTLLAQECSVYGQSVPPPILAVGNTAFARFESDDTGSQAGFYIFFGKQETACQSGSYPEVVTESPGSIASPGWPSNYPNNAHCEWHIQAPAGQHVQLTFLEWEFENCCGCDYVEIYNGASASSPRVGRWYSRGDVSPGEIISSGQDMYIVFTTDFSIVYKGFIADYEFVTVEVPRSQR